MNHNNYPTDYLSTILSEVKTIALVGASDKPTRPSYRVMAFLLDKGYTVIPVNPGKVGQSILEQPAYATLADIPNAIDMVDIFRNSAATGGVVNEALALNTLPKVIWMQLEIRNNSAARLAEQAGIKVVMDRCPKIEYDKQG